MLLFLFMQLFYKSVWLISVDLALWLANRSADLTDGMLLGVVLDLIIIP